jgi:ACS family glucarate transporter-like MFS transporter
VIAAPRAARRRLLQFTFFLSLITFLDRVAIGTAAPAIRDELHLTPAALGWAFSAFTFAYAAFEIPTGWLGDRFGPRKVLTRIVLWWSFFTAATGAAWNFASLVATRFLFGMGEAGAFPNISRSFSRWFPVRERGIAHGIVFMGSRIGGALAPPLVVLVMGWLGWRAAFWIFGSFGAIWCLFWWRWFRDDPADHPSMSVEELNEIKAGLEGQRPSIRWRSLLSMNLMLVCLMYFCVGYGLYFYLTWLPTYFQEARGFSTSQAALLSSMVLLTAGVATFAGGWLTDSLVRRFGLKVGRSVGAVAMPLSGVLLIGAALTQHPIVAAVLFAGAAGAADLCLSPSWAICHDIGGEAAGTVTGCMNTFGNLGGALSPLAVGYALQWWGSWETPLLLGGGVYILAGLLTLLIDPRVPLETTSGVGV